MKKFIIVTMLVVTLIGCSSGSSKNSAKVTTCTFDSGASKIVNKVVADSKGNDVSNIVFTKEAPIADYMFEEHSVEELQKLFEADYINPKNKNEGIEYKISIDQDKKTLSVKIEIDATKATEAAMAKAGLTNQAKSLDKLVEFLKGEGYTCKAK